MPKINRDLLAPLSDDQSGLSPARLPAGSRRSPRAPGLDLPNRDRHRADQSAPADFLERLHRLVRLLDRREPFGHVHFRSASAVEGAMAQADHEDCGTDDDHLRDDRHPVCVLSLGAVLAMVLPDSLSQPAGDLAGFPLPADVGCHGGVYVCDRQHHLSVSAADSRLRLGSRSHRRMAQSRCTRRSVWAGAARKRNGMRSTRRSASSRRSS